MGDGDKSNIGYIEDLYNEGISLYLKTERMRYDGIGRCCFTISD